MNYTPNEKRYENIEYRKCDYKEKVMLFSEKEEKARIQMFCLL